MRNFKVLSKDYIVKNGIEDDSLVYDNDGYRLLDADEEDGGNPINGLVYALYKNGSLSHYAYYIDGLAEGDDIDFYPDGKLKEYASMVKGMALGNCIEWYPNGQIKRECVYSYGVPMTYTEYDENGNVTLKKIEPTKEDIYLSKRNNQWFQKT